MKIQPFNPSKSTYQSILVKQYGYQEAKRLVRVARDPLFGLDTWMRGSRDQSKMKQPIFFNNQGIKSETNERSTSEI